MKMFMDMRDLVVILDASEAKLYASHNAYCADVRAEAEGLALEHHATAIHIENADGQPIESWDYSPKMETE